MQLAGATVLLTGATGGLGEGIARELAGRGARLVLSARRTEALEALAAQLPGEHRVVAADLADRDAALRLAAEAGPVDVLVANAGLEAAAPLETLDPDEVAQTMDVNLVVPALLARELGRAMLERGRGHVVFMSSMAGKAATPGNGPIYTATKWGLRGLALALREDWRGTGVGVSAVFPGPVSGAGMFASTGVALPRGAGTVTVEEVARAVAEAIQHDRAEIDVAPIVMRLGGWLTGAAPLLVAALARRGGARRVREEMLRARRGPD